MSFTKCKKYGIMISGIFVPNLFVEKENRNAFG
jgi:hypothetical protein